MSMQEKNNYENAYECKYRIHSVINELICVIKTNLYDMNVISIKLRVNLIAN